MPTYQKIGDHTETIQIDFDPERISYERLLDLFWEGHDPTSRAWSRQYMAMIFFHDEAQKTAALASRNRQESAFGREIHTKVLPFTGFTPAENYHQKYHLQKEKGLMQEFTRIYPDFSDFVDSTAAARVNGYLGGYGTAARLEADLDQLGLSPEGRRQLLELFGARRN